MTDRATPSDTYSYLGPAGTFTEAALKLVEAAAGKPWRSVNNVGEALDDVVTGRSVGAVIAIENSVDGGVSATQDAWRGSPACGSWASTSCPSTSCSWPARTALSDVRTVNAHPVAYAQTHRWLEDQPARPRPHPGVVERRRRDRAARRAPRRGRRRGPAGDHRPPRPGGARVVHRRQRLGGHPLRAVSRTLAIRSARERTRRASSSSCERAPGALVDMLEQFATRGASTWGCCPRGRSATSSGATGS